MVEGFIFLGQGVLSERRPLYDQSQTFDDKFSIIRSAINSLRQEIPTERGSILTDIIQAIQI